MINTIQIYLQVHHQSCSIVTVDVELVDTESQMSVSQSLIDAGYAEQVEPISGRNTSKLIKESTMTSLLVDSSRQGESMLADVSRIAHNDSTVEHEEQMILLVASVDGINPDDFTCVLVPNSNSNYEMLPRELVPEKIRKKSLPCITPHGEPVEGYVSAVMSPAEFYIHCTNDDLIRDALTVQINESYNQSSTKLESVREGELCCAKFSEDGEWYRAEIKDIADGDVANVLFVDFGNMDEIAYSELKELKPEFHELSPQAYPCRLKGVEPDSFWEDAHVMAFTELTADKALTVTFLSAEAPFEVDLNFGEEQSITTEMMLLMTNNDEETSLIEEASVEGDPTSAVREIFPPREIPTSPTAVTVPHVESLKEIFLNIDTVALDALMAQLADIYEAQSVALPHPRPGVPCAVKYCDDDQWYRALILDMEDDNMVNIMFIDYGNCDSVPAADLKVSCSKVLLSIMIKHS